MLEGMGNGKLILVRHGQSEWNKSNQFTGWVDVDLTEQGEAEAVNAGKLMEEKGVLPDILFTSLLRRAIPLASKKASSAGSVSVPNSRVASAGLA